MENRKFIDLKPNEISVDVIGACASGKTYFLQKIQQMLVDEGFSVNINLEMGEKLHKKEHMQPIGEALYKRNTKIRLNEVQAVKKIKWVI